VDWCHQLVRVKRDTVVEGAYVHSHPDCSRDVLIQRRGREEEGIREYPDDGRFRAVTARDCPARARNEQRGVIGAANIRVTVRADSIHESALTFEWRVSGGR